MQFKLELDKDDILDILNDYFKNRNVETKDISFKIETKTTGYYGEDTVFIPKAEVVIEAEHLTNIIKNGDKKYGV